MIRMNALMPEYAVWKRMRDRCENPRALQWRHYGGKGIRVDPRWYDPDAFLRDVGSRPSPRHIFKRVDEAGNFEPGNVAWVAPAQPLTDADQRAIRKRRKDGASIASLARAFDVSDHVIKLLVKA